MRRRAAVGFGGTAALTLAAIASVSATIDLVTARRLWAIQATGYVAAFALTLSLLMSLLHRWRPRPALPALRRSAGLTAAGLGEVHAALVRSLGYWTDPTELITEPHLRAGATALVVLGLLAVTSFPSTTRLLGKSWRSLHVAVYGAAAMVAHHILLSPVADPVMSTCVAALLGLIVAARLALGARRQRARRSAGAGV